MALVRRLRKGIWGLALYRAGLVCIAALSVLLARSAPPSLPHLYFDGTVNSLADHDHRQCFDHQDFQWGTSPSIAQTAPPPVASPHLTAAAAPFVEIVMDGWHYNRPPPIS
jgi:hypothetical protein